MELALYTTVTTLAVIIVIGVIGYLIDRGAARHEAGSHRQ